MKTKNYWFALKSYAYVEFKEKNMLIYDTKHGDRIETAQEKVITLIKEMYEPNNLGVIPISNELQFDGYRTFSQQTYSVNSHPELAKRHRQTHRI